MHHNIIFRWRRIAIISQPSHCRSVSANRSSAQAVSVAPELALLLVVQQRPVGRAHARTGRRCHVRSSDHRSVRVGRVQGHRLHLVTLGASERKETLVSHVL